MRFICDVMFGKLGRWLRMFGYDTLIATEDQADKELLSMAREEGRILLTRDKRFNDKTSTYYVKEHDLDGQLKDVIKHFKLEINFPKNTRCPLCNGALGETQERPKDLKTLDSEMFWKCEGCGQIYWKGSHWNRIMKTIEKVKKSK
jgi:uncharacterized protein with PIN domain